MVCHLYHFVWFLLFLVPVPEAAGQDRPNVVVIMLDDMGYSDPGSYGSKIQTPNMDLLAQNGLRFTQFYNGSRCSPTRASLLTGLYPHQVNMGENNNNLGRNGVTIAEALGTAGYETAMSGKWHLSRFGKRGNWEGRSDKYMKWLNNQIDGNVPYSPRNSWPSKRGFDRFYGCLWGVVNFFNPFSLARDMAPIRDLPDDYYITDAISRNAARYVKEMNATGNPFFLYVSYTAPHWPLHAPEETIQKYRGAYDDGWNAMRRERYQRQIEMGLFDQETHPLPEIMGRGPDWEERSPDEKKMQARKMAVHAAMVDRADQGIGQVLRALKQTNEFRNTLIFVLSDNGASPETPTTPGYDRPSETEDGKTIHYHHSASIEEMGSETSFAGIGSYWANASNTPFRYWKKESFKGGNNTPLIVHWPVGMEREDGSITDQRGHVMDLFPTILDVAGVSYPDEFNGHSITPVTGKSLLPVFKGKERAGHDALFFEHESGKAVIENGWKAVQPTDGERWFLYHLKREQTEITDWADERPDRLKRMISRWEHWYRSVRFSRRTEFSLTDNDALAREQAPYIRDRPFTLTAQFEAGSQDGVIVAQGGNQSGYALYVLEGQLRFALRRDGVLTNYTVQKELPPEKVTVTVRLDENRLTLLLNDQKALEETPPGLLTAMPLDGLQVGRDLRSNVGSYEGSGTYDKTIHSVYVQLR